jgi:hypothetical protein
MVFRKGRPEMNRIGTLLILTATATLAGALPASAQFVCTDGIATGGSTAGTGNSVSCGTNVHTDSAGGVAFGVYATNSGTSVVGNGSVAVGNEALATGTDSIGVGNTANVTGNNAIGLGAGTVVSGNNAVAVGQGAQATADGAAAFGQGATASAADAVAIGRGATADAAGSIAIGQGASTATFTNSMAIGQGVVATRNDQVVIGTTNHTYTLSGVTSAASRTAQGAPTHIITSNANGDLAAHTAAELGLATPADIASINARLGNHQSRIEQNAEGIAIALAMAGTPVVLPKERFAMSANWGNFEGRNGFAGALAFKVTDMVQLNGGLGFGAEEGTVGGRAGIRIGW